MTVPWSAMNISDLKQMGVNLIRSEQPPVKQVNWMYGNEVSGWFRQWYHTTLPEEFGQIVFK